MPVTQETYQRVVLEDPEGRWELHRGRLREKPAMSYGHNRALVELAHQLLSQLDKREFEVGINTLRTRRADETYNIPDVAVVPVSLASRFRASRHALEVYDAPLPLVVEVWSPSTGDYDVDAKLPEYMRRGDREIWRLHPFERSLRVWQRRADGGYDEMVNHGGRIAPASLPGVSIDLDALFAEG